MKDNSMEKIIFDVLIDRIKPNDKEFKTVEQILNSKRWETIDLVFGKFISDEIKKDFKIESFYSFDKSTQRTIGTLIISPLSEKDKWKGEELDKSIDFYSSYDFHIELKITEYSDDIYVDARLDLHTNPYKSVSEMRSYAKKNEIGGKQVETYYEERHRFIKMKEVRNMERPINTKYSSSRDSFLYVFKNQKPTTFSKSDSVSEISEYLNDTILEYYKFGQKFVEVYKEKQEEHYKTL